MAVSPLEHAASRRCLRSRWTPRSGRPPRSSGAQTAEVVNDKRATTPDTAIRLAGYFGTRAEFWLNVQMRWDLWHDLQAHPDTYRTVAKRRPKAVRDALSA